MRKPQQEEIIQCYTGAEDKEKPPLPRTCREKASEKIDAYSDGSVKNPRGDDWKIEGIRMWRPMKKWQADELQ